MGGGASAVPLAQWSGVLKDASAGEVDAFVDRLPVSIRGKIAQALESDKEHQAQSCGTEPADNAIKQEQELGQCASEYIDYEWSGAVKQVLPGPSSFKEYSGGDFAAIFGFAAGIRKGGTVQLVTRAAEYQSHDEFGDEYEFNRGWILCAEGIVVSVEEEYIEISLEMALTMEWSGFQITTGRDDKPCYDANGEDPWAIASQDNIHSRTQIPWDEAGCNSPLEPVMQASSLKLKVHLMEMNRCSPWTFSDVIVRKGNIIDPPLKLPAPDAVKLLFRKWEWLQQFISETHDFYFLSAERLRSHSGPLPKFQDLMREGGWLSKKALSIQDVMKQTYAKTAVTASHTWFTKGNPFDPEGIKMQALITYLKDTMHITDVWLDYSCVPQGDRTPDEQALFDRTLPFINLLYLGTKVLRMIRKDYFERFWPQFEAYLSKQAIYKYGFKPEESARCDSIFLEGDADDFADSIAFFDRCTYDEAVARLSGDDVKVTNLSDKTTCLTKLQQLKEFMAVIFNTLR
jgi:hypothetical protein